MSIIYEALKKVEGQKKNLLLDSISEGIDFSVEKKEKIEMAGKKVSKGKKIFFLPVVLLLVALGISMLSFILPSQKQDEEVIVMEKRAIDPARIYKIPESNNQLLEEVTLRESLIQEYVLEGIIYDLDAPFALINGKVMNESDNVGNFRIDKISEDKVEMINIQDNNIVTLSLLD